MYSAESTTDDFDHCGTRSSGHLESSASERLHFADESDVEPRQNDQRQQQHEHGVEDVAVDDVVEATDAEWRVHWNQPRAVVSWV